MCDGRGAALGPGPMGGWRARVGGGGQGSFRPGGLASAPAFSYDRPAAHCLGGGSIKPAGREKPVPHIGSATASWRARGKGRSRCIRSARTDQWWRSAGHGTQSAAAGTSRRYCRSTRRGHASPQRALSGVQPRSMSARCGGRDAVTERRRAANRGPISHRIAKKPKVVKLYHRRSASKPTAGGPPGTVAGRCDPPASCSIRIWKKIPSVKAVLSGVQPRSMSARCGGGDAVTERRQAANRAPISHRIATVSNHTAEVN